MLSNDNYDNSSRQPSSKTKSTDRRGRFMKLEESKDSDSLSSGETGTTLTQPGKTRKWPWYGLATLSLVGIAFGITVVTGNAPTIIDTVISELVGWGTLTLSGSTLTLSGWKVVRAHQKDKVAAIALSMQDSHDIENPRPKKTLKRKFKSHKQHNQENQTLLTASNNEANKPLSDKTEREVEQQLTQLIVLPTNDTSSSSSVATKPRKSPGKTVKFQDVKDIESGEDKDTNLLEKNKQSREQPQPLSTPTGSAQNTDFKNSLSEKIKSRNKAKSVASSVPPTKEDLSVTTSSNLVSSIPIAPPLEPLIANSSVPMAPPLEPLIVNSSAPMAPPLEPLIENSSAPMAPPLAPPIENSSTSLVPPTPPLITTQSKPSFFPPRKNPGTTDRSSLLAQIQAGSKLKKVKVDVENKPTPTENTSAPTANPFVAANTSAKPVGLPVMDLNMLKSAKLNKVNRSNLNSTSEETTTSSSSSSSQISIPPLNKLNRVTKPTPTENTNNAPPAGSNIFGVTLRKTSVIVPPVANTDAGTDQKKSSSPH